MNDPITIYALMDGGECLYVGQTARPRARATQHRGRRGKIRMIPSAEFRPLRICSTPTIADRVEKQVIAAYKKRQQAKLNLSNGAGRRPLMDEEDRADSQIQLRVRGDRKAHYASFAKAKGLTLSQWVFAVCDPAAGHSER